MSSASHLDKELAAITDNSPVINSHGLEASNNPIPTLLRLCFISNPNTVHARRWVNWFHQRGHQICLIADVPLKAPWPEVTVIDLSKIFYARFIRFPIWTIWIRRFVNQWHPDVLHAHRVNSAGWLAAATGFHPFVVTPWGSDIYQQPQRSSLARLLAQFTLRHADLITTLSDAMDQQVVSLGASPTRLRHINFGVELNIFNPGISDRLAREDLLTRLDLPPNARLVLSGRALAPIYNQDIILETIPLVRQSHPNVIFIFREYNADPIYKKQLENIIKRLGIEANIRWLPATRSRTEMAELYRLSDMVISVPTTDGTPVSVLEAMACAKPVVSSDLPSLREYITSGENGWLVPVRQVASLSQVIIRLLENPGQAREFGQKGYQAVVQKANLELEMQRMEGIYRQIAGDKVGQ